MDPIVRKALAVCRLALRDLVLMMGEHQVGAAAMDVEGQIQILLGHRRAFDMPAGTTLAPGGFPRGLAGLGGLPDGEVQRIALAVADTRHTIGAQVAMAGFHLVHIAVGQLAVLGEAADAEVDIAFGLVGMAGVDQALDQLDHFRDLLGRLRTDRGVGHAGLMHVVDEGLGELRGNLCGGTAGPVRLVDDLVVHVGDVLHEGDVEAPPGQIAADDVEADEGAGIADMDVVVHGGAADVHADLALVDGLEFFLGAGLGVVNLDHMQTSIGTVSLTGNAGS